MARFLYDDDYAGPLWTYGLLYRPIQAYGIIPMRDDFILLSARPNPKYPNFGTVQYARELTSEELETYEMELVSAPETLC